MADFGYCRNYLMMKSNKKFLVLGFSPGLGVFLNAIVKKLHEKGAEAKLVGEIAMGRPVPKNFKPDETILEKIIKYENEFYNPEDNPKFKNQIKRYATRCLYHLKKIIEEEGFTDLIVWNGQLIFTLAGIHWAEKKNMKVWYMENGALPGTLQLDEKGVNTESSITGKSAQFFAEHDLDYDTEQSPIEPLSHPNKTLHPFEMFMRYINRFGWYWWMTRVFWKNFLPDQRGKKIRQSLPADKATLPEKFIFVPLQVHDDTQIMVHSPLIKNMEEFIDACHAAIKKVNPDMPIVVKEHPQDFGRQDYSALRQKYPGIIWLRKFPINDILAMASTVITVNSGVGIEALTFKRPVITLGDAFYNIPGVVRQAQTLEELPELIKESLTEPVNSKLINNYLGYLQKHHLIRGGWKKFSQKTLDDFSKRLLDKEGQASETMLKTPSKKPNILYIIGNSETGGVPILIMTLIENLKPYFNFGLIAPNDGPYFEKFKEAGIETIAMPIRRLNPSLPFAIARKIKEYDIDLIHSHGKAAGLHSRFAGLLTDKPVVHSFHGIHFKHHGILARPYCAFEKFLGKLTTAFIATAEHERETPIKMGWSTPEKIGLIRNAVPKSTAPKGLPRKKSTLLSVGRFYPGKGQNDLVKAMPKILQSLPDTILVFVGGGSDVESAKKLAKDLGVYDNIKFMQNIPQETLDQYYAEATIYISPSHGEGFSLTIAEAGQVGTPVIATDVTGNNEIVEHDKSGLLVPAKDPEKMAEAVIYLLKNPEKAELFANNLETRIKNDFSLESLASKTTKFYNDVIERWKKKHE